MKNKQYSDQITLRGVRLSFPHLFTPYKWPGEIYTAEKQPLYEATLVLDKVIHKESLDQLNTTIDQLFTLNELQRKFIALKNICLKDFEDIKAQNPEQAKRTEYENSFLLRVACKDKPPVYAKDAVTLLDGSENMIYSGCYVDACIYLKIYTGKSNGVKAILAGIQFIKDGKKISKNRFDPSSVFFPVRENEYASDIF